MGTSVSPWLEMVYEKNMAVVIGLQSTGEAGAYTCPLLSSPEPLVTFTVHLSVQPVMLFVCETSQIAHEKGSRQAEQRTRVVHEECLR
jgi:hypothetical protein